MVNTFGVWFKIEQDGNHWIVKHVACLMFFVRHWLMEGLNMQALAATGEELEGLRKHDQSMPPERVPSAVEQDQPMKSNNPQSSHTERGRKGPPLLRRPRGDGDNPFIVGDLNDEDDVPHKPMRLKGIPPKLFTGDRSQTFNFLNQFKRFMRTNHDTTIARSPFKKSTYFLSLIEGPDTEGWTTCQDEWLNEVEEDQSILPWRWNE
jgi:hypothetical protein